MVKGDTMNHSDEADLPPVEQASGMTHEQVHALKNIFSTIIANTEMLAEHREALGATEHRRLDRILSACRRGETLIYEIRGHRSPAKNRDEAAASEPVLTAAPGKGFILVVDDQVDIVEIICRTLRKAGFTVHGLTDSREALETLQTKTGAIDLLITDFAMPHLSGKNLCQEAHALRPNMPILLITGCDRVVEENQLGLLGVREVMVKPVDRRALVTTVRRLLPA